METKVPPDTPDTVMTRTGMEKKKKFLNEVSNMTMLWNFEIMLGQMLNHSVYNSVILWHAVSLLTV
jgi:hypothetical protein